MSGDISRATPRRGYFPPSRAKWLAATGTVAAGLLLISACSGGGGAAAPKAATHPSAKLTITSGNLTFRAPGGVGEHAAGAAPSQAPVDTRPDLGVRVSVTGGRLAAVLVRTPAGKVVPGTFGQLPGTWQTGWALRPAQTYRVTATAISSHGQHTRLASTFRTFRPARGFTASTTITRNEIAGVGMPIMVTFSRPIRDKAAVERSLEIWSSKPVTGAWYWMDSRTVWFRPKHYWPRHTHVRFAAHLAGVQGAPGVFGRANLTQNFRIGNSLIAVANTATHHMRVWWNGKMVGNWPISSGRPGMDTANGRYLSFAKANPVDMNSATIGIPPGSPGYYNELVYDAVQFTMSGTYIHSAPWSVGEQGIVNVSHGCVNVAPGNAIWYYNHSVLGDPISVVGSPVRGTWGNGWTIYFLSWHKLLKGSATGNAVRASSTGSRFVPGGQVAPGTYPRSQQAVRAA
jgi:lipoprotein-anchoring transpeptidase ErfK/SrfK